MKNLLISFFVVSLGSTALPANAQQRLPFKATSAEIAVLPDYCKARLSNSKEAQAQWSQKMGKDKYMHLHHFCDGLNQVNRARLPSAGKHKKHYLQTALAQFNYVIRNWPADFYLTSEAINYKSQIEFQLKLTR